MAHLESSFKGRNGLWRYAVMIGAVFVAANTVGAIPLIIGIAIQSFRNPEAIVSLSSNPYDLSYLGLDSNITLFMLLFPFAAGLAAYLLLIRPLNGRTFTETVTGTGRIRWSRIVVSAIVWSIISAVYLFIYKGIDPGNFIINNLSGSLAILIVISLLFIPLQSGFEEVIFRGYLMQGFTVLFRNRWLPIVITSLFFGLMHSWNPEIREHGFLRMMPQYLLSGLLFGVITVVDDGIEIASGAHIANNIFLSIMVTNSSSTLKTAAVYEQLKIEPGVEFIALLGGSVIFYILMKLIYCLKNEGLLLKKIEPEKRSHQIE
jgi:hypothetical protein